jgi:hypothetical protein
LPSRDQTVVFAPAEDSVSMLGVCSRNQTRILKRKSVLGERADGADVDGVERVVVVQLAAGKQVRVLNEPRLTKPRTGSLAISAEKRMQREQRMQRSSSSVTRGPRRVFFGLAFFSST